jgi:hypothetical protein
VKEKHDALVEQIRNRHKESTDSLTSRFNETIKLKDDLEARVKVLASEVEELDPVRITVASFLPTGHYE